MLLPLSSRSRFLVSLSQRNCWASIQLRLLHKYDPLIRFCCFFHLIPPNCQKCQAHFLPAKIFVNASMAKILQKKLSGQKLDRNKLRGKKLNGKKIEQKSATKIRQRTRFFDRRYWAKYKFCGVPTQMGGCRFRRGQAGCQGGLRLVQQHHHYNLYINIITVKTTIINIVKLAAKGVLQALQHQPIQKYLPYKVVGWGMLSSIKEFHFHRDSCHVGRLLLQH